MENRKGAFAPSSNGTKIPNFSGSAKKNSTIPLWGLAPEIKEIIEHYAKAYECVEDITAAAVFAAVAAIQGKKLYLPYQNIKDYACNYFCIVAPSGSNKTSPVQALLEPLELNDARLYDNYCRAMKEWRKDQDKDKPQPLQTVINDATTEAMFTALERNSNGVLIYSDEIRAYISNLDRYNKGDSSPMLLNIWNNQTKAINRKTEDLVRINEPCLTILGGIQPRLLQSTFGRYSDGSGFLARWLFFYPELPYREVTEKIELMPSRSKYWFDVCRWLSEKTQIQPLQLTKDAKGLLQSFVDERKMMMRFEGVDPDIAEIYGKSQTHIWRLLVLLHTISYESDQLKYIPNEITSSEVKYAISLMEYLELCAGRVLDTMSQGRIVRMSSKELIKAINDRWPIQNISALAEALGISKQYISKVLLFQDTRKTPITEASGNSDADEIRAYIQSYCPAILQVEGEPNNDDCQTMLIQAKSVEAVKAVLTKLEHDPRLEQAKGFVYTTYFAINL